MTVGVRTALFAGYCVFVAVANYEAFVAWYGYSLIESTASHVVLVPGIAAALVVVGRREIFAAARTWWRGGLPIIAAGSLLLAIASAHPSRDPAQSLTIAAVVTLWIGGFVLLFGPSASRSAAFPLAFLWFSVPLPALVLNPVSDALKQASTTVVEEMFRITGTPYNRTGFVFRLPFVRIEVADACSGIRSTIGLLITSLLAGHLFLTSGLKKAVLVLAILPVTVFKNGIRITTLSLLSIHVDRSYLTGQLHHEGGVVFFILALAMLAPLFVYLLKSDQLVTSRR